MGSVDREVDDRTFRVNFSGDGAAMLRERVKDKLREFMGDYTDDTLVEYVVVLLRNGRRKEEARNELNVFLGDDSHSFVSWLWDHLASNLDLYVHPQEVYMDEVSKTSTIFGDQGERDESQHVDLRSEKGNFDNLTRSRHKREWKNLTRDAAEPPALRSSEVDNMSLEDKTHQKLTRARRSSSPQSQQQKKRGRHEGRQHTKREVVSQATIDAPRRLLQFAVRDAVRTLRPSSSVKDSSVNEPSLKRLRSVVSTPTGDSLGDHRRRIQSIAGVPNPLATVVKAVQEASEDVKKVRSSGSVFDRLGHDMDVPDAIEQDAEFRGFGVEDEYEDVLQGQTHLNHLQRSDYTRHVTNMSMMETETGLASDLMPDNEGYDDVNAMGHRVMDVSQTGASSGIKGENLLMMQYKVAKNASDTMQMTRTKDHNQSASATNTSGKLVNVSSVNVNAWKSPHYYESRDIEEVENLQSVHENEVDAVKLGARFMKENSHPVTVGNGHAKLAADVQKESSKALPSVPGSYTAGRPSEDADSRTIFISNVHFAATKDSLSRHFNKFGEVLKVVIVTDATTGQPKGSAFVEFMRKEAADNALSLDGTSFMSRILKVVKRSSAHQETTPIMTWPRIVRGSPYATSRFARVSFPRGIPGAFRTHFPKKSGARSLQWKRDNQVTTTPESGAVVSGNTVVTTTPRSMTYVRTEPKPDGNLGTT